MLIFCQIWNSVCWWNTKNWISCLKSGLLPWHSHELLHLRYWKHWNFKCWHILQISADFCDIMQYCAIPKNSQNMKKTLSTLLGNDQKNNFQQIFIQNFIHKTESQKIVKWGATKCVPVSWTLSQDLFKRFKTKRNIVVIIAPNRSKHMAENH